jgi:hypothetical protein
VKVNAPDQRNQHVVPGTQRDNMRRMANAGRYVIRREGRMARRARSVALR